MPIPDDEILWFNPKKFDKIIIVFLNRLDKPWMGDARLRVIDKHPLKKKIELLGFMETDYFRNKSRRVEFVKNYEDLLNQLPHLLEGVEEIYTHNPWGEYNHPDHILVHQAVRHFVQKEFPVYCFDGITPTTPKKIRLETIDLDFFHKVKLIYQEERAWTWANDYIPQQRQPYFLV